MNWQESPLKALKALRVYSNGDIIDSIIITMIFPFVSKVSCTQRGLKSSYSRFFAWLNRSSKYKLFYWGYFATYVIVIFRCWSIFCISTKFDLIEFQNYIQRRSIMFYVEKSIRTCCTLKILHYVSSFKCTYFMQCVRGYHISLKIKYAFDRMSLE